MQVEFIDKVVIFIAMTLIVLGCAFLACFTADWIEEINCEMEHDVFDCAKVKYYAPKPEEVKPNEQA